MNVPAIATLHTVLTQPTTLQRTILTELIASCEATVVMSQSAADLLVKGYGVPAGRLDIIPHGVPDLPLMDPAAIKPGLDLEDRQVILGFGLLRPDKGYELMIEALPQIVADHPTALFVVLGATHPDFLKGDGEAYRASLQARVDKLKLGKHVRFVDRFVGRVELTRWLEAADVFVTPNTDLQQSTSGTLAYAMGAGRAIVSTPYSYAVDLLADGRGLVVAAGSPKALATAVNTLLDDDAARAEMGRRAYEYSRGMVWSEIGERYRLLVARVTDAAPVPVMDPRLAASART